MKVVLTTLNAKYIHSSLALRYLEKYCRAACENIEIKEYTINNQLLDILSDIYAAKPDVICLACYIWNIEMTLQLASLLRKVLPDATLILGGPEVSFDAARLLAEHTYVDYIILGEGENVLNRLLRHLEEHSDQSLTAIEGLVYREKDKVIDSTPQIMPVLDDIPFPYTETEIADLSEKIIYYESSRGCPFSCQYCLSSATQGVRYFSLDRTFQDMEFFIKQNVRQVKFVDRTFNAKKEHYFPLMKFLARQDCRTNFHFEIAVDLLDDEVLEFLQTVPAGRFQLEIGVQSTYEPTLVAICRHNNWDKITQNIAKLMSGNNIHLHLDLIIGLPYEDFWRFGQSFNDVYALKPHMLQIGFLKMLKGAGVRQMEQEHGYVYMDTAPYEVLANRYLSYEGIRELKIFEDIFEQTYNSGRLRHTFEFLISQHQQDAFRFYHEFTGFWQSRNLHQAAHSTKALYEYLLVYCEQVDAKWIPICKEYMKIDALLSDRGAVRPEFLAWNAEKWNEEKTNFWRSAEVVKKYLPEYAFHTWREIKKKYHIEVFSFDVLKEHAAQPGAVPMLFSYEQDNVSYQYIDLHDFMVRGNY
ncbi:MAG: B12-binding domain-containing radical SAM protein [Pelosinus sp.]|nr:B12-binding domain-containing radical SAM protein [Pelosinus sp.]